MIDLHTHSLLSDGELLPSELARRYEDKGFKALAITDHADLSNLEGVADAIVSFCHRWPKGRIHVIPGVELTHLPLTQFKDAVHLARRKGVRLVVAHGETLAEPVLPGTNKAALLSGADILSHPGLISEEDVRLAAKKGVFLEISARKGHCLGNGHVGRLALKYGASLCINSDSHSPGDVPHGDFLKKVGRGAGLTDPQLADVFRGIANMLSHRD
jgi:histidinol phosphatase-like PHP family hydrolase